MGPGGCKVWERDNRGVSTEEILSKEGMMKLLRHFPLFFLVSPLQAYLVLRGMKRLEEKGYPGAFVLFSMAAEHSMELGNLGLALLYGRC